MNIKDILSETCSNPITFAELKPCDKVLVLNSGMGITCMLAQKLVGDTGYVVGIENDKALLAKAKENVKNMHLHNVDFIQAEVENIPINYGMVNAVLAQCAFGHLPNISQACIEVYKVLAHLNKCFISDIIIAEKPMFIDNYNFHTENEYKEALEDLGFEDIEIIEKQKVTIAGLKSLSDITCYKFVISAQKPQAHLCCSCH